MRRAGQHWPRGIETGMGMTLILRGPFPRQKTGDSGFIKGPVEFGLVINALQYRDSQAVLLEQTLVFSDVDLCRGDSRPMENCLCFPAEVAERVAVKPGICQHWIQISTGIF